MGSESFLGGAGVDMMYMSNPFADVDWNTSTLPNDFDKMDKLDNPYPTPRVPAPLEFTSVPPHMLNIPRPKSSPSTFGPNVEDLLFSENPFKISRDEDFGRQYKEYPSFSFPLSPVQSAKEPSPYLNPTPGFQQYGSHSARTSPARHMGPIPIMPNPIGMNQMNALKRFREDEDFAEYGQRKRKRAVSNPGPVELNEEEQLLLKLKEEENLPWKDIATRFQSDLGKSYQVPALQMRLKRLRERMRSWTDVDVQALEQAYDYWEKNQFEIIAQKMVEFGASERWPAKYCARKWEELHPGRIAYPPASYSANLLQDPWASEHCSPVLDQGLGHSPHLSMGGHSPRPSVSRGHSMGL